MIPVSGKEKKILILIWITLSALHTFSQSDYREAYIITTENDTVKGFIDYNSNLNYECKFKRTPESEMEVFKPFEIISYRFTDDKYFVSKSVELRKSYTKISQLEFPNGNTDGVITSSKYTDDGKYNQNVFLEFLVEGELKLYYLMDRNLIDHYYVETNDSLLLDLTKEQIQAYSNGILRSVSERNTYQSTLKYAVKECPGLFNEIDNLQFRHKDMIKIATKYHDFVCPDQKCIVYERRLPPIKAQLGIVGGGGISVIKGISYNIWGRDITTEFKDLSFFLAGIDLNIRNTSPNLRRITYKIRLEYWRGSYKSDVYTLGNQYNKVYGRYISDNINLSIIGLVHFSTNTNSPYFGIGISSMNSIKNELNIEIKNTYSPEITKMTFTDSYKNHWVGGIFSLGYEYAVFNGSKIYFELVHKQRVGDFDSNLIVGYEF